MLQVSTADVVNSQYYLNHVDQLFLADPPHSADVQKCTFFNTKKSYVDQPFNLSYQSKVNKIVDILQKKM